MLFLPTYTATAWYHKRLAPDLQRDLSATLREVEAWAAGDYTVALAKGDSLTAEARATVAERLARYTGLSQSTSSRANLRVEIQRFCKELLRDQERTVGRLDSRFTGFDRSGVAERPDFDPSLTAIRPPVHRRRSTTTCAASWASSRTCAVPHPRRRHRPVGLGLVGSRTMPDTGDALRDAFAKNPHMRVFVASGYFDLATPYFATEYTLAHLGLPPSLAARITRRSTRPVT